MCQVQGDDTLMIEEVKILKRSSTCLKCDEAAVVIARVKDAFCRHCFLGYVTHRFKATIGKSRLIRDKEKVLIAFSGGQNSSAVARLIHEGRSENQHKRSDSSQVSSTDDGIITQQTPEERRANRETITKLMNAYDLPTCVVPIEEVFSLRLSAESTLRVKDEDDVTMAMEHFSQLSIQDEASQRLQDILDSVKSLTAKEDLVKTLRHRLLADIAKQTGHTKVMLGDNGTNLASRVLSGMAQGRGVTVPLEVGFADNREGDSTFVRPLREFPSREVSLYNHLMGVESVCIPTLTTKASQYASINKLTDDFIHGLQVGFPSTVSTVLRTGEKLCMVSSSGDEGSCIMCKAPLDTNVSACSALESTQHSLAELSDPDRGQQTANGQCSLAVSCETSYDDQSSSECCGQGDGSCHSTKKTISFGDVSKGLCYGCRITVRDMKGVNSLPGYVLEEAGRRQRRSEMKEEIQDFLLTDDR
ncbi:LOW QUALITY PROTEIN: cytoplasmic tRNA 2-thiolation protein 2 [Strongylocentrotus purpuratus]|uniref:Cytoplasmic tRNA 2-thiolation protein 2 n=1 Tax=Strongylocentrotus purpuratus TaxID=7668 RepID=A0A7M7N5R9_STRPU|nr:LOW QUALITY PROTEIN: cytoplasmic tRNA 2-thiolation protein 2 [Strongylocentrotus purpuratus]